MDDFEERIAGVRYSTHAMERMEQRSINRRETEAALSSPDTVHWPHGEGPIHYRKQIRNRIVVVVVDRIDDRIITVYAEEIDRPGFFPIGDVFRGYNLATA